MKSYFSKISVIIISCILLAGEILNAQSLKSNSATDAQIWNIIQKHRPSKGAKIPANIKDMLGATHVGGKYFFTNEPYIIEGTKKLFELGFGVCKLWFYKNTSGYLYNSLWNLPKDITLKQLAQHPYYQQAFAVPFSTIVLSTGSGLNMLKVDSVSLIKEEKEYYELTKYLLTQYKNREVTFILENWEGDWIVRGGTGWNAQWGRVEPPADTDARFKSMQQCFIVRQRAVNRARAEIKDTKCKVYHAVEVNKVIDGMYGVPSITTQVLPFVEVDMVSWSAYDATDFDKTGVDLYKGIDFIKSKMKPTKNGKEKIVFLGEIGIPEMGTKNLPQEFKERWDSYIAVCIAQKVPYFIQWELYCNETVKGIVIDQPVSTKNNADMNGFWLIRPDGTKSYVMNYFNKLLKNAGSLLH